MKPRNTRTTQMGEDEPRKGAEGAEGAKHFADSVGRILKEH